MNVKRLFLGLVVAELVIGIVTVVLSLFPAALLPQPLAAYHELQTSEPVGAADAGLAAFAVVLLVAALVATIGLLFFWRPARPLYLITTALGLLATPLFGPQVTSSWEAFFLEAGTLISGAVIALMYFSPVREQFGGTNRVS